MTIYIGGGRSFSEGDLAEAVEQCEKGLSTKLGGRIRNNFLYTPDAAWVALSGMYAQCGMLVAHNWHTDVDDEIDFLSRWIVEIGKAMNYTKLITTLTPEDQSDIMDCLKDKGWQIMDRFTNRRSGNEVVVFTYEL